jgi:hypothetical protein
MAINYQLSQAAQIPTFNLRCADWQTCSSIFAGEGPGEAPVLRKIDRIGKRTQNEFIQD